VGLQVVARTNREADVLRLSAAFESARPWANSYPELPI
jgi:Asp-tRNA(Asn)/Glu-tRNA(Gln) amidotransferase A subunit family amidase